MASTSYVATPRPPPTPTFMPPPTPRPTFAQQNVAGPSNVSATPRTMGGLAHKHAHHLHSIPPREKSVRTLILDHMLWMHARVRLRQARAELGMRTRSSNVEVAAERTNADREVEEHAMLSEGEDVLMLKFGAKERQRDMRFPSEDDHLNTQKLSLARALRLRADGVEKVVTAMVDQPPEVQPPYVDEDTPRTPAAIYGHAEDHLPNGVRYRLALSTLINDLFSRDVPTPISTRTVHSVHSPPSFNHAGAMNQMSLPPPSLSQRRRDKDKDPDVDTLPNGLPTALASLSLISSFGSDGKLSEASGTMLPSFSSFARANNPTNDTLPPILGHSPPIPPAMPQHSPVMTEFTGPALRPSKPIGRVLQLYKAGADPATANSPPSLRCPRHLHHSCVICAAVKLAPLPTSSNPHGGPGPGGSGGSGSVSSNSPSNARGAIILSSNGSAKSRIISAAAAPATGVESWKSGGGVGTGLAKPGVRGTALRRRTVHNFGQQGQGGSNYMMGVRDLGFCAVGCKLVDLVPRFLRLSALIALELGREAADREQGEASEADGTDDRMDVVGGSTASEEASDQARNRGSTLSTPTMSPTRTRQPPLPNLASSVPSTRKYLKSSTPASVDLAYRPTREWYAILCGLLTRAILEGYLSRGWKGPQGMECLMSVGLGLGFTANPTLGEQDSSQQQSANLATKWDAEEDEEFAQLDPDDYPTLLEAARVLFPSLRMNNAANSGSPAAPRRKDGAEAEFEQEMCERLTDFLTVPATTPDLSTHFEDLTYKFPAEPVERAAVRFCEAVTRWRGKPELENYKKKTELTPPPEIPAMSINSHVVTPTGAHGQQNVLMYPPPDTPQQSTHPQAMQQQQRLNQPRRPSIEKYFIPPPQFPNTFPSSFGSGTRGQKRRRNTTSDRAHTGNGVAMGAGVVVQPNLEGTVEEDGMDADEEARYRSVRWAGENMGPPLNMIGSNGIRQELNVDAHVSRYSSAPAGTW